MNYLIGNKNGIIGFISITESGNQKNSVFCSFENNFFKKHPFDPDLIMQNPKNYSFESNQDNEKIVELTLMQSISNFDNIKDSMGFYWFEDDWADRRKELEKIIQEVINKG